MAPPKQNCAACKKLRCSCDEDCIFRAYFPLEKDFENAHRLFGYKRIEQILTEAPLGKREAAAYSLKYEANMRAKEPIYGTMRVITDLQKKLQLCEAERNHLRTTLAHVLQSDAASSSSGSTDSNNLPPPTKNFLTVNNQDFDCSAVPEPFDFFSGEGKHGDSHSLPPLTKKATNFLTTHRDFDYSSVPPQLNDFLSGEGQYGHPKNLPPPLTGSASNNYQKATKYLASQQAFDFLSDEGHYGNFTQLPNLNNLPLPPYPRNNDNGQTQETGDTRTRRTQTKKLLPGSFNDNTAFSVPQSPLALALPHPNNHNGNDIWKSMINKDDRNPFL